MNGEGSGPAISIVPTVRVGTHASDASRPTGDAERRADCVPTRSLGTMAYARKTRYPRCYGCVCYCGTSHAPSNWPQTHFL
jgi:hypothetical protein